MIDSIHAALRGKKDPTVTDLELQIADHKLDFKLTDFASGPVADISKRLYSDLVTPPNGDDVIDITQSSFDRSEDISATKQVRHTEEFGAEAKWSKGQIVTGDLWNTPFSQVLPIIESDNHSQYTRYASVAVTVSLEGRSRNYKAMFLFGSGEYLLPLDNVTNNSALAGFVNGSVYPGILLGSDLSQKAGVRDWLRQHRSSASTCVSGQRTVCCDPSTLVCGLAAGDVEDSQGSAISPRPVSQAPPKPSASSSGVLINTSAMLGARQSNLNFSDFDQHFPGPSINRPNTAQHNTLNHNSTDKPYGTCDYTDQPHGSECNVIPRVDRRRSPTAFEVRRFARGQEPQTSCEREGLDESNPTLGA
jgi:hypothetical protein